MRGLLFSSLLFGLIFIGCSDNVNVENDGSSTDVNGNNAGYMGENDTLGSSSDMYNGSSVYFEFDKFTVDKRSMELIKKHAKTMIDKNSSIKLEGNADERGSDEYNYALALKRASSVKDILIGYGVKSNKIKLVSYGESKPKCLEQTQKCYRENRRVDLNLDSK